MALTKTQKNDVVKDVSDLLATSKLTVVAQYQGTGVKQMQELRRSARESGTTVKVVKNRLVKQALATNEVLKDADNSALTGQLLYAFNGSDEVAPAQDLANFAKQNPSIQFVGAITADGQFIGADDVKQLASLPSKDQLRAQLVGTIVAPLSGFVNVMSGSLRGMIYVLQARSESL